MFPGGIVGRETAKEAGGGGWGLERGGGGGGVEERGRRVDVGGRRVAGNGGWGALDLLVRLVGGVSADEFVLLELDDDVGASVGAADIERAGGNELYMDLADGSFQ